MAAVKDPEICPRISKSARVLIVDDEPSMGEMLADGLTDRGYEVNSVVSSRLAIAALEREEVDVLVTDLLMPDTNGLRLLGMSRSLDPTRPVILMSGQAGVETAIKSIRQGAYHFIVKPFRLDELAIFIDKAFDESRIRREVTALRRILRGDPRPGLSFAEEILPMWEINRRYAMWAYRCLGWHKAHTAETLGVDVEVLDEWLTDDLNDECQE